MSKRYEHLSALPALEKFGERMSALLAPCLENLCSAEKEASSVQAEVEMAGVRLRLMADGINQGSAVYRLVEETRIFQRNERDRLNVELERLDVLVHEQTQLSNRQASDSRFIFEAAAKQGVTCMQTVGVLKRLGAEAQSLVLESTRATDRFAEAADAFRALRRRQG